MLSRRALVGGLAAIFGGIASGCVGGAAGEVVSTPARSGAKRWAGKHVHRPPPPPYAPRELMKSLARLVPLHERKTTPKPGEWLYDHPERGQSFEDYLGSSPTVPTKERRTIVVEPLGELGTASARVVELTGDFLSRHFGLPVRTLPRFELGTPPAWARRRRDGDEQYLTQWLLKDVLPRHLPSDAMALAAFLETDLWPGENWNYVFGEATLADRVGVWSLHRYGDPSASADAFKLALRRALKIAAHETGHMFSLHHCTAYECLQAGVNSLDEADASPLWLCPDCLAKISWATSTDPRTHLERVREFCRDQGLAEEEAFFAKSREALGAG